MNNKKILRQYFLKKRIGVLMGGWSSEREISLRSGKNIYESLKKQGFDALAIDIDKDFVEKIKRAKIDIAFIILHGKPGEDGTIQGTLELLGIPYTGSGVAASAVGMDKVLTKQLFQVVGVPTPPYVFIPKGADLKTETKKSIKKLGFPMMLKPRSEGSSVGVEIINDKRDLLRKGEEKRRKFGDIFLEKFIKGMIATCGILGERALPILELVPKKQAFYDYKAKYTRGETEFIIPARLEKKVYQKTQELALLAHHAIGASGFSRVDLVVENNQKPYFLEVNTLPGMTDISDLPAEAAHLGISYDELVFEILCSAKR